MFTHSFYNLKIISSGTDRIEIYKVNNYSIIRGGESKNKSGRRGDIDQSITEIENIEKKELSEKNRKLTLNAARNNIVRLVSSNPDMITFITLTFAVESDYKESKKYLNNLFNKLRRDNKKLKYLWVLEFGEKNNRLHYHFLSNIKLPSNIKFAKTKQKKGIKHKKFEEEFCNKYWSYGFVDIRNLEQEGNSNVGLYISVYITKDLLDKKLEGYRIYGYSAKTLEKPTIFLDYTIKNVEDILKDFYKDYDLKFSSSYEIGETGGVITYFDLYKKKGRDLD
ncbi:MAG: rolling circle replication-associated protein [Sarcina sp.]